MRIATYNVEWFDALFDDNGRLFLDDHSSARYGVTRAQQTQALARVFGALDADGIMVVEAPDTNRNRKTERALTRFARQYGLRARDAVIGFANDTQQEIAFLFDPDVMQVRHDPRSAQDAPRFDEELRIDLDQDASGDPVVFSKPPLELAVTTTSGQTFRMIGAHLKSKAPHGARTRDEVMRVSIANRRKQLAQAIWLNRRVTTHVANQEPLIVLGDLNDGPGLDEYEKLFGRSSVEIVMGQGEQSLYDPHAAMALQRRIGAQPTTSRFYLGKEKRYLQALLDYVMISPDLRKRGPKWRIWHPFDDATCWRDTELCQALLTASDHFPVTLDLDL